MNTSPRIWPETPSRRAARAVLAHLAGARPDPAPDPDAGRQEVTDPSESDPTGRGPAQGALDDLVDLERRLVALDALGALDRWLPAWCVLAPVDPRPGDIEDAYRLLTAALQESYADSTHDESGPDGAPMSARDVLATGLAAARLRPLLAGPNE